MDFISLPVGISLLRLIGSIAVGYVLLRLIRWIHRQSPLLALIAAGGLLARAFLGIALFSISYLDLAFLRDLHTSDGFWIVAPDARDYFVRAADAAEVGLSTVSPGLASPGYVRVLAAWMKLTGISPASALFLNVALFTVLAAAVVYMWKPRGNWRDDLPCIVLLGSLAFAPSLVIHGTQALKDDMVAFLIALGSMGVLVTVVPVIYGSRTVRARWIPLVGLGALMLAVYCSAGIRTYYAFFMFVSITGVLLLFVPRLNLRDFALTFAVAALVVVLTGAAYVKGAGAYDFYLMPFLTGGETANAGQTVEATEQARESKGAGTTASAAAARSRRPLGSSSAIVRYIDSARVGFVRSGGGTNLVSVEPPREPSQLPAVTAGRETASALGSALQPGAASDVTAQEHGDLIVAPVTEAIAASAAEAGPAPTAEGVQVATAEALAKPTAPQTVPIRTTTLLSGAGLKQLLVGLGSLYVPISVLRLFSVVSFSGGRGLLAITDIDTIFLDLTLVASLVLLYQRWSTARQYLPYVLFLVALSTASALLMAYVVTNYGTMFRLRMMTAVPIWMLAMSLTSGRFMLRASPPNPEPSRA